MKENHLMLQAAVARLKAWTDALASAKAAGDEQAAGAAERFVDEYTALICEMRGDAQSEA